MTRRFLVYFTHVDDLCTQQNDPTHEHLFRLRSAFPLFHPRGRLCDRRDVGFTNIVRLRIADRLRWNDHARPAHADCFRFIAFV